jgi:hypothetical protein
MVVKLKTRGALMKKYVVLTLLLCPVFSLYAQSNSAAVYVPPVTGTGSKPEDNELFYKQLVSEVRYQEFIPAKTKKDAEYSLVGTLSVFSDNASSGTKQYVLHLALIDNKTNQARSDGDLVYEVPEDVSTLFPSLVYTLLYTIPESSGKDNWRNKNGCLSASARPGPPVCIPPKAHQYILATLAAAFSRNGIFWIFCLLGRVLNMPPTS